MVTKTSFRFQLADIMILLIVTYAEAHLSTKMLNESGLVALRASAAASSNGGAP